MTLKRLQLIEMPMLCRRREWEALPALISGFTAGKASSAQVNKVIRQASFIAAALAQFVSDKTQRDVLDNGDLPGFVELLGSGFAVEYLSRKNPFGDIKSDGTVKTALQNLGLGEGCSSYWRSVLLAVRCNAKYCNRQLVLVLVFLKFNGAKFSALIILCWRKCFLRWYYLKPAVISFVSGMTGEVQTVVRELLSWQAATNFSQFAGNIGEGAGHAINFHDGIAGNQPGFSRFNFTSNSVGDGVNFVAVRPRNIAFNFLVRAK